MKKNLKLVLTITILLVLIGMFTACSNQNQSAAPETTAPETTAPETTASIVPIKWQVQNADMSGTMRHTIAEHFCEEVAKETNGALEIELFSADTLYPSMTVADVLTSGMAPAALTFADYFAGKEPYLKFRHYRTCDPWPNEDQKTSDEFYDVIKPIVTKAYDSLDIKYVGTIAKSSGETFNTTVPINSLDDFKGMTVRTSGLGQELFQLLGSSIVTMPMADVYSALKLGTVDAAEIGGYADNYSVSLHEVVNYSIEPAPHQFNGLIDGAEFLCNKDAYAKLTPEIKAGIDRAIANTREWSFEFNSDMDNEYKLKFEEAGVETIYLSQEDVDKIPLIGAESVKTYWGASEICDEFLKTYIKFLRDKGYDEVANILEK